MNFKHTNKIALILITILLLPLIFTGGAVAGQSDPDKPNQKQLEQEAAANLGRAKKSIEKDGFYIARVALNIWRSNAMDAGTFDQELYDELKQTLYEKSTITSLKCFEYFLLLESHHDANICLQTWRMHSRELGTYDKKTYQVFKEKLDAIKKK
jgi:hypothetical protein